MLDNIEQEPKKDVYFPFIHIILYTKTQLFEEKVVPLHVKSKIKQKQTT